MARMFTWRHHRAVAKMINQSNVGQPEKEELTKRFADFFLGDNDGFNYKLFRSIALKEPEKKKEE